MRVTLLTVVSLAAVLVAGCGGSSDQTASINGQTITVPGDVHGLYGELEAILAQLPYQHWYTRCVVDRVKEVVSPAEAESLAELPESEREKKAMRIVAAAGPACEKSTARPVIDPNASDQRLDLFRAGYVEPIRNLAEEHGLDPSQTACVERRFESLPDKQVVALLNGTHKVREGILVSVFKPCAKVK